MYEGFEIPGGTIVVPNVWYVALAVVISPNGLHLHMNLSRAIAFEEKGPYDPKSFVLERFLEVDEENLPVAPTSWAFGFARR